MLKEKINKIKEYIKEEEQKKKEDEEKRIKLKRQKYENMTEKELLIELLLELEKNKQEVDNRLSTIENNITILNNSKYNR